MKQIVFVGHSGGGQLVHRYSVISPLIASLYKNDASSNRPGLQFVVANPSSYPYFNRKRYPYNCGTCQCDSTACTCDGTCTQPNLQLLDVGTTTAKATPLWPCSDSMYNDWPYGVPENVGTAIVPYVRNTVGSYDPSSSYYKRNVVFLVGQNDTW
jgi:hypothetical protein